jgi:hypothetical protein
LSRLATRDVVVNHARLNVQLRVYIYANQRLIDLVRPSLITAAAVLMAGVLFAIPKDLQWPQPDLGQDMQKPNSTSRSSELSSTTALSSAANAVSMLSNSGFSAARCAFQRALVRVSHRRSHRGTITFVQTEPASQ